MLFLVLSVLSVISGPTESKPGELVVLKGETDGGISRWILPPDIRATISSDNQLAIAPTESIKLYLVSFKDGDIKVDAHQIRVGDDSSGVPNLVVRSNGNATVKQWQAEMQDGLLKVGWKILYVFEDRESPTFEVTLSNGHQETVTGYLTAEMLTQIKERGS